MVEVESVNDKNNSIHDDQGKKKPPDRNPAEFSQPEGQTGDD